MFVTSACVQAELGAAEEKTLTLQSQFGGQHVGVTLMLKCLQVTKEIRGNVWHSWSWLRDSGLPHNTEVTWKGDVFLHYIRFICKLTNHLPSFSKFMCTIQGMFARLQSRAQVIVDGRSLLTSGLNISTSDGRLSLLLSVSPPTSAQTQPSLTTTLTAQLKGRLDFWKVLHI